jgi:hypothetical protein
VFAELRKYQQLYQPRASVFFYRDQQNREVDFVWSRAGHIVLMEARWAEHVRRPDASVMETVAGVFNPTTTAKVDSIAVTRYAASIDLLHHQEAAHVTSLSDCRRRILHSHV